jgi:hypothetical protein
VRIAVIILGIVCSASMIGLPLYAGQFIGLVVLVMGLLWLLGIAFVYGLPLVSVIAFAIAGVVGIASAVGVDLSMWGPIPIVLALLGAGGYLEKKRADMRAERTREHLAMLASSRTDSHQTWPSDLAW